MANQETRLSRDAYERLRQELADLEGRGRVDIARIIERARELGDLSENADYHAAKDAQGKMEARIRQIQGMLDTAVIVEGPPPGGAVAPGSVVAIRYEGDDDVERYLLGSIEEKREGIEVMSPSSPLGQALMGKKEGDVVEYTVPSGATLKVEVVEVGS